MSSDPTPDGEDGMTLVELIISGAVGAIVMTVLASLFITNWQTDSTTRDRDTATGAAHVVTNSLQTSLRNASAFQIDDSMVRARVATGSVGWRCRGWRLANQVTIAGQDWYQLQYIDAGAAISATSPGWRDLLDGPENGDRERLVVQGLPTADRPFNRQADLFKVNLRVVSANTTALTLGSTPVPVGAAVTRQAKGGGAPLTCW